MAAQRVDRASAQPAGLRAALVALGDEVRKRLDCARPSRSTGPAPCRPCDAVSAPGAPGRASPWAEGAQRASRSSARAAILAAAAHRSAPRVVSCRGRPAQPARRAQAAPSRSLPVLEARRTPWMLARRLPAGSHPAPHSAQRDVGPARPEQWGGGGECAPGAASPCLQHARGGAVQAQPGERGCTAAPARRTACCRRHVAGLCA